MEAAHFQYMKMFGEVASSLTFICIFYTYFKLDYSNISPEEHYFTFLFNAFQIEKNIPLSNRILQIFNRYLLPLFTVAVVLFSSAFKGEKGSQNIQKCISNQLYLLIVLGYSYPQPFKQFFSANILGLALVIISFIFSAEKNVQAKLELLKILDKLLERKRVNEICVICLCETDFYTLPPTCLLCQRYFIRPLLQNDLLIMITSCDHVYHGRWLLQWVKIKRTCPRRTANS